jgi:hypothetical protein
MDASSACLRSLDCVQFRSVALSGACKVSGRVGRGVFCCSMRLPQARVTIRYFRRRWKAGGILLAGPRSIPLRCASPNGAACCVSALRVTIACPKAGQACRAGTRERRWPENSLKQAARLPGRLPPDPLRCPSRSLHVRQPQPKASPRPADCHHRSAYSAAAVRRAWAAVLRAADPCPRGSMACVPHQSCTSSPQRLQAPPPPARLLNRISGTQGRASSISLSYSRPKRGRDFERRCRSVQRVQEAAPAPGAVAFQATLEPAALRSGFEVVRSRKP